MMRLIQELLQDVGNERTPASEFRIGKTAFEVLHEASEMFVIGRLHAADVIAEGERTQTLMERHIQQSALVAELMLNGVSKTTKKTHHDLNNGRIRKRKPAGKKSKKGSKDPKNPKNPKK
jgi:histone H3/H4